MGSNTLYIAPCILLQDGTPGPGCKVMEPVTEAMLITSLLRIELCKTLLAEYGYRYSRATITGPCQQVYLPGKLIEIVTPHFRRRGRVETWLPSFAVRGDGDALAITYNFTMAVRVKAE